MQHEYVCLWHILDYSHKILLGLCIGIFGIISIILNGWLAYAFLRSHLLTFRSHLLLLSLCIATQTKSFSAGFILFGTSALAGKWLYGIVTCHLFAFLRQMLGIFQIASLTLLAIERYIVTRPERKGNELPLRFYVSGLSISWLIALLFSLPPLLGYGRYNCDVGGIGCELDWSMLSKRQIGFNAIFLVFGGILPVLSIFTCLWGANCTVEPIIMYKSFDQKSFTKTITIMTSLILLFWLPQGILDLWIFFQNLHPPRGIPVALSVIAPISSEAAEIVPVLCYLTYDSRIRTALLDICEQTKKHRRIVKFAKPHPPRK